MFNLTSIAITIHALSALIWVGGMVFAYSVLRPALSSVDAPTRLNLWSGVLSRFFIWVWIAVIALPASGYVLMFHLYGGFSGAPVHIHIMHLLALIMITLFIFLFFMPYRHFNKALKVSNWPLAAKHLNTMRRLVAINMTLGLITVITGASGRYWG